jgi:hypothetical protein
MQVCPKLCSRLKDQGPEAHSAMQCELKNVGTKLYLPCLWLYGTGESVVDCKDYAQKCKTINLFCAFNFKMLRILEGSAQLV